MLLHLVLLLIGASIALEAIAPSAGRYLEVATYNLGNPKADRLERELMLLLTGGTIGGVKIEPRDVIAVQEARDRRDILERVAKRTGARLVQDDGPHGRCALLIAAHVKVDATGVHELTGRTFVGRLIPGAKRTGHTGAGVVAWARIRCRGVRWVVGSTHFVPSGTRDGKGYELAKAHLIRQAGLLARWMTARVRCVIVLGDLNAQPKDRELDDLKAVAQVVGPKPGTHDMHRIIDLVCTLKAPTKRMRLTRRTLVGRVSAIQDHAAASDHDLVTARVAAVDGRKAAA